MLALALLLATAPVLQMSEQQLDRAVADAHLVPAIGERVERLSALFVGVPYGDYPLGEGSGVEPQPRWRVDKVDCQTFVETVLAMANAKSLDRARAVLDDIRYAGDPPKVSFSTRNHFTEAQWLPSNFTKGYLREETRTVEDLSRVSASNALELDRRRAPRHRSGALAIPRQAARVQEMAGPGCRPGRSPRRPGPRQATHRFPLTAPTRPDSGEKHSPRRRGGRGEYFCWRDRAAHARFGGQPKAFLRALRASAVRAF